MAGIMAVGELGHAMESLLEAVVEQRGELGRDGIPLLERGFDRLHAMVTRVGERRAIDPSEALIERSEEHTSELQSLMRNSYAVFCLKKKKKLNQNQNK